MKRSLQDQQVAGRATLIDPYYDRHDDEEGRNALKALALLCMGAVLGMCAITLLKRCETDVAVRPVDNPCMRCHSHKVQLTGYFRRAGSRTPEEMANAVLHTRSPRLLAAVATVETGGNPAVRNGGYKRRHQGAFQVNPRHWGVVPQDAVGQALQAENILSELTGEMPIRKALSLYGGDSTDRYQKRVLAELVKVP